MHASATHTGARTLFERARRVLAGQDEPAPPQEGPVDIRFGIERVLRHARKPQTTPRTVEEAAARAVFAVEGTLVAIDTIHEYLVEALDLTTEALRTPDTQKRAMIADRYEQLRSNIDTVAAGASFQGVNLIDGGRDALEVRLPLAGEPRHAISHITLVAGERGLSIKSPSELFASEDEIEAARQTLTAARHRLDRATDTFLNQASMLAPHLGMVEAN
jgi:flagellin-like hook-associated protein FlgL